MPRSTYYRLRGGPGPGKPEGPIADAVEEEFCRDAGLMKAAFATVASPLFEIEVFHADRDSEFDNAAIDEMLGAFGIARSLPKKGCPYDNAVDESTDKTLKAEFVHGERFGSLRELQVKLSDYVWWYNNERMHSTLGYMSPVEFRKAGLSL